MAYYHRVTVKWSDPIHISEAEENPIVDEHGVYFITRVYIRNGAILEKPLYVGVTKRSFYQRLNEHYRGDSRWRNAYGQKSIRFGIVSIYNRNQYDFFKLLTDIESQIIWDINEEYPGCLLNKQQTLSYAYNYCLDIRHVNNDWLEA